MEKLFIDMLGHTRSIDPKMPLSWFFPRTRAAHHRSCECMSENF